MNKLMWQQVESVRLTTWEDGRPGAVVVSECEDCGTIECFYIGSDGEFIPCFPGT